MALYRVQGNGKAPAGLQAGDEVVTGGGTYRILGVNADGSYRSSLSNKYQTIYNYRGSYGTAPAGQTDTVQVRTPGYTPSGAASEAKAALDRVLSEKPGSYTSRWDKELDALYDQIANRKAFSYDLGADPMYRQYREQYQSAGRLAMENTMGAAASLTGGYGSSYSQQAGQPCRAILTLAGSTGDDTVLLPLAELNANATDGYVKFALTEMTQGDTPEELRVRYVLINSADAAEGFWGTRYTLSGDEKFLPDVTASDNGKFLRVSNGAWTAVTITNANGGSF